ncbi:hypothetical protein J2847_002577 [Azospirillum agricola]|uniref:hypothetical protein n=1 Tax=Azospirillum agricola TaxID=1720247 RepID=UPI001AE3474F|nr:hypothetical protein [Azospirillum agricola]MBP2229283.1 hypothetical protein [Azospirillum agricola]
MPRPAIDRPALAVLLLTGLLASATLSPAHANTGGENGASGLPADFPTLSSEPVLAQRQAMGCSVVGLGLTGLALASGVAGTGGVGGPVVGQILTYFGAGCTMGVFIATAFPTGDVGGTTTPAQARPVVPQPDPAVQKLRLRLEAAALIP